MMFYCRGCRARPHLRLMKTHLDLQHPVFFKIKLVPGKEGDLCAQVFIAHEKSDLLAPACSLELRNRPRVARWKSGQIRSKLPLGAPIDWATIGKRKTDGNSSPTILRKIPRAGPQARNFPPAELLSFLRSLFRPAFSTGSSKYGDRGCFGFSFPNSR